MPRAIAPEVTTTTSTPRAVQRGDLLADARDDGRARSSPVSSATIDGSELDDGDGHAPRQPRTSAGSSSKTTPPISTSSPGSKPSASSARDHAHPPQPVLDVGQRLLVLEVVAGDQALDRARPMTRNSPSPTRSTLERARRGRAEDAVLGDLAPRRRRLVRRRLLERGTRRSSSRASSSRPDARRARGDEHRDVVAEPLAPLARPRPSASSGSTRSALESASTRGSAASRGRARPARARSRVVLDRVGAVERREVEHVHEQPRALDVREEVVAEAGAGAGALDQPGDVGDHELAVVAPRACRAPARAS